MKAEPNLRQDANISHRADMGLTGFVVVDHGNIEDLPSDVCCEWCASISGTSDRVLPSEHHDAALDSRTSYVFGSAEDLQWGTLFEENGELPS